MRGTQSVPYFYQKRLADWLYSGVRRKESPIVLAAL